MNIINKQLCLPSLSLHVYVFLWLLLLTYSFNSFNSCHFFSFSGFCPYIGLPGFPPALFTIIAAALTAAEAIQWLCWAVCVLLHNHASNLHEAISFQAVFLQSGSLLVSEPDRKCVIIVFIHAPLSPLKVTLHSILYMPLDRPTFIKWVCCELCL